MEVPAFDVVDDDPDVLEELLADAQARCTEAEARLDRAERRAVSLQAGAWIALTFAGVVTSLFMSRLEDVGAVWDLVLGLLALGVVVMLAYAAMRAFQATRVARPPEVKFASTAVQADLQQLRRWRLLSQWQRMEFVNRVAWRTETFTRAAALSVIRAAGVGVALIVAAAIPATIFAHPHEQGTAKQPLVVTLAGQAPQPKRDPRRPQLAHQPASSTGGTLAP